MLFSLSLSLSLSATGKFFLIIYLLVHEFAEAISCLAKSVYVSLSNVYNLKLKQTEIILILSTYMYSRTNGASCLHERGVSIYVSPILCSFVSPCYIADELRVMLVSRSLPFQLHR